MCYTCSRQVFVIASSFRTLASNSYVVALVLRPQEEGTFLNYCEKRSLNTHGSSRIDGGGAAAGLPFKGVPARLISSRWRCDRFFLFTFWISSLMIALFSSTHFSLFPLAFDMQLPSF